MSEAFLSPFACAGLTCAAFALGLGLYRKTRCVFLHPVLVSVTLLIVFLTLANIPYETYNRGGGYISVFLSPAVVALGVSLYKEAARIRREALPLFLTTLVGSLTGLISVVVPAVLLGAPEELTISLAPKSVTTAIAVEISSRLGGVPSLSAAIVILTGVFGTALGPLVLRLLHITEISACGLAMGFAAHGVGTARSFENSASEGAFAGLGLCLNGLATAVLTPVVVKLFL